MSTTYNNHWREAKFVTVNNTTGVFGELIEDAPQYGIPLVRFADRTGDTLQRPLFPVRHAGGVIIVDDGS